MVERVDVGSWLRRVRRDLGMSQREFARKAGVSPSVIARIESGAVDPRFGMLWHLVNVAGFILIGVHVDSARGLIPFDLDGARDLGGRHFPAHLQVFRTARGDFDDYWFTRSADPIFAVQPEDDRTLPARGRRRPTPRTRRGRPPPRRGRGRGRGRG